MIYDVNKNSFPVTIATDEYWTYPAIFVAIGPILHAIYGHIILILIYVLLPLYPH